MELTELLEIYSAHPNVEKLNQSITSSKLPVQLRGLKGGAFACVASSLIQNQSCDQVIVMNDKEEAAYLYNDIQALLGEFKVEFYPSKYQRSIQYGKIDQGNILIRTEILSKLAEGKSKVVLVTYPEAFMEKVVKPEQLISSTFTVKTGESLSREFLIELLNEYGFERTDFVYEPGQFAVRGSLIDVFSFSGDEPYRIDFFGDEINSIRVFDIENQLTKSKPDSITIIPNVQVNTSKEDNITLWDFFPSNTVFWFNDAAFVQARIGQIIEYAKENPNESDIDIQAEAIDALLFKQEIQKKPCIEFGNTTSFIGGDELTFSTSLQPAIRKNFDLLASTLNDYNEKGYKSYLLSDNPEQIERLTAIYHDRDIKAKFNTFDNTLKNGFVDHDLKICCFTDHQIFERYHKFKIKSGFTKKESITIAELTNLHVGDYVVHIDHGIGKFGGLQKVDMNGKKQETIKLIYRDNDVLFVTIHSLHRISKYKGKDTEVPKVHKLGSAVWQNLKTKTKKKVKDIAKDLIKLYAERKEQQGYAFSADSYLNQQLEASFLYEDTPDQSKATKAVKSDMESETPMDRLVCGDVGFGKTEIAIRAAFKAVADNKQVAILVPTTILALQHFKTFSKRLSDFPCNVDYISRLRTGKEQKEVLKKLEDGSLDIVVGTHKLVGKDIKFKDLGLLIIDEEQKFGVSVKEKLKQIKTNVDTLILTATPIPRTLQFSLMGARDLSIMNTPPPNRQPINTEVHAFNEQIIQEAVNYEMDRNGQVFFINNRVQNIGEVSDLIAKLCPKARIVFAHGQMDGKKLEQIMLDFIEGKYDVLVATTIIESGLDIPNANTIIINQAQNYGLSDMHQLRGRVGRSNKKAFCYLLAPPPSSLSNEARRRLKAIEDFSELGSGFNISLQDLDIRGAGNILGAEQSGFIGDLGFEAYQKILNEALIELKQNELKDHFEESVDVESIDKTELDNMVFVSDCYIDTDMELLFPEDYVESTPERINLYRKLDAIDNEEALIGFNKQLVDRFGEIPEPTIQLLNVVRLRWIALKLGIERIFLKNNKLTVWFISDNTSLYYQTPTFQLVLSNMQRFSNVCKMQEKNNKLTLTFEGVKSVNKAIHYLQQLNQEKSED